MVSLTDNTSNSSRSICWRYSNRSRWFHGFSALVFVTNQGNGSVSIIDDMKGRIVSNVKTHAFPFGIGIDSIKNQYL